MDEGHESDHDSTLVLDIDQELSALKQESTDLASLLDQSSPESHIVSSPTNFIARNITAIKSLKRKEPKVNIDPVASPIRLPKPIPEDSHLLKLTQATRDKIVRPDMRRIGSNRSQTPQPEVTIRKVKRTNSSLEGKTDRSVSAPRMRQCEDPVLQMYATPSFQAPDSEAETSLDNPQIVPRLKHSPDLSQVPDPQLEKLVSTESFERSLPMIMSQAKRTEPEPGFPDPFSDETVSSRKIGVVFDRFQQRKDREHDTNLSIYRTMDQVIEVVLTDESGSEGPEEIWRYLQHWFTLYYADFRRQTLQELLGLLILRGNYKRAQNPKVAGISLSERAKKRSRQGVVTFKEMEKRLDEVLSKGRATITRTASLIDSRSSSEGHFHEKIGQFLNAGTPSLVYTLEDPIDLLQPAQIVSTALETTGTQQADFLIPDILLSLFAPKMKLMERRHLSLSLETMEIRTKLTHATTGINSLAEKANLIPKLIALKQFEEAKEATEDVRKGLMAIKSKGKNDTVTGLRREMTLWSAWIMLLRHTSGPSIDRSVLGGAMEQIQKHSMSSRSLETLRKICLIYLFYHTSLWRSEDRALSHLRSMSLGEWEIVLEADLKFRTEDPLAEAAAAELLLLHLDAAPHLRFIMFMRLARHYKAYELHEKILSAGKKVLLVHPPLCREHSALILSTMLKSQGVLDPAAVLSYQVMVDKSDFSILYQYARVSIKWKINGTAVTARNALEMLLAYAEDYAHLRKFLFQFQVTPTQFWKFLLYKVNCFHRTATHLGSNLLAMTAENSVQKRSVEKFLNEMKEVKLCLHEVYEKCKRKDLQSGKWVEDTVRKVERLDPYLGLCLFIALEVGTNAETRYLGSLHTNLAGVSQPLRKLFRELDPTVPTQQSARKATQANRRPRGSGQARL